MQWPLPGDMVGSATSRTFDGSKPMTSSPLLVIDEEIADDEVVLQVSGEIDDSTVQLLEDAAAKAIKRTSELVVVDLTEVRFLGSTGLNRLLALTSECRVHDLTLVISAPQGSFARQVVEACGLQRHLVVRDSLSDALQRQDPAEEK